ncbi:MAG: PspA/IM30 family protein [Sphaerochaetaceae bacterium]|nr:PspA/IM30 family protein [Sphaerochaetaceae bacterium]MDC7236331.1 PspA/IM30 family protein [Sphaerochaetaceae bacterium]MDC7249319.1 PspA/IM30 family protein [Sphaerochaetaceae bacterium]
MKNFKRFKNIVNSNLNSALNSLENPEKMIRLMITDLEETLSQVKRTKANHLREKSILEKDLSDLKERITRWESRAKLAVEKGKDDLAREALNEKRECEVRINRIYEDLKSYESILMSDDESVAQLATKLKEIKEKQASLVRRAQNAKTKKKVESALKVSESFEIGEKFNDLEARIEQMENEVNLDHSSHLDEFEKLEINEEIEAELEKLKAQNKKNSQKKESK